MLHPSEPVISVLCAGNTWLWSSPELRQLSSHCSCLLLTSCLVGARMKSQAGICQAGSIIKKLFLPQYFVNRNQAVDILRSGKWKTATVEHRGWMNTSHWAAATKTPYRESMERDQTTWTWTFATVAFNSVSRWKTWITLVCWQLQEKLSC